MVRRHVAGHRQAARPSPAGRGRARRPSRRASGGAARRARRATTSARIARSRATAAASAARRPAAQPEDRRDEPVVRLGAVGQRRVLGVVDDRQPERARVGQRVPQDRRGPDRRPVVARTRPRRRPPARRARRASPLPGRPSPRRSASSSTGDPDATAAARTRASTPGSSSAGVVFGIAQTVVNPPWAAAASPVAIVSASSLPGSRRWAWRSMKPGRDDDARSRRCPSASAPSSQVTASRIPSRDDDLARALAARRRVDQPGPADLEVRAPRRSRRAPVPARVRAGEQVQQRHPDRDAVRDLVRDDRLRRRPRRRRRSRRPRSSGPGA